MAQPDDLVQALRALRDNHQMLSLAGCLLLRQLDGVRPATRDAIAAIEAWARHGDDTGSVETARRAAVDPSPLVTALYALALNAPDDRDRPIQALASLVPWLHWAKTELGRALIAKNPGRSVADMTKEPAIARALEARRAELAATVTHVFGVGRGNADAIARYDAVLDGRATGDRPQPLIHHGHLPARPDTRSEGDRVLFEAVGAHLARHVEPAATVFRDRDARWVRVDLHAIARPDELVLVTSGMAERPLFPMYPATAQSQGVYTELVLRLPASWPRTQPELAEPRWVWPLGWLGTLARGPHRHGVAVRPRQTSGPVTAPLPPGATRATDFDGVLFLASTLVPPMTIVGRTVEFLAVCPLFPSELAFARARGTDALLALFAERGLDPERVDAERPELVYNN